MRESASSVTPLKMNTILLYKCAAYSELREKYISKYFWKRPNMFKFVELINSSNINYIRKLCIFIYHAFKLRTELLYNNDRL